MLSERLACWRFLLLPTLCFMLPVQCITNSYQRQGNPIYTESNLIELMEMKIEHMFPGAFENLFEEMIQRVTTLEKEMLNLIQTNKRLETKLFQLSEEIRSYWAEHSHNKIEPSLFTNNMQADFNFTNAITSDNPLHLKQNNLNTLEDNIKEDSRLSKLTAAVHKHGLYSASRRNLSQRNINNRQKKTAARVQQHKAQSAKVAFTAHRTHEVDHIRTGAALKFDGVTTNIGSGYNHFTGAFTCHVAGTYVFYHNLEVTGEAFITHLMKNGVMIGHNVVASRGSNDVGSGLTIINLHQGDTVWVETAAHAPGSRVLNWGSTFSGFLLYQN